MKRKRIGTGAYALAVSESADRIDVIIDAIGFTGVVVAGRRIPALIAWLTEWQAEQDAKRATKKSTKKRKRGG